jgi:hypothetical protein
MKNSHTTKNSDKDDRNSQNPDADPKSTGPKGTPYDPENPRKESQSDPKDINGKDIEKNLIENDPSQGLETDMDTQKSDETESDSFETLEADQENPVKKEFEIGELGNEELKEDERARDATDGGAPGNYKPSQRKFKALRFNIASSAICHRQWRRQES